MHFKNLIADILINSTSEYFKSNFGDLIYFE